MNQSLKIVLTGIVIGSIPFLFLAWLQVSHPNGDINMESTSEAPAKPDPVLQAQTACVSALRNASKYPSTFDFSPITDPPKAMLMNDGSYLVRVDFSARNSFGATLPQAGHCSVRDGVATITAVDPR